MKENKNKNNKKEYNRKEQQTKKKNNRDLRMNLQDTCLF